MKRLAVLVAAAGLTLLSACSGAPAPAATPLPAPAAEAAPPAASGPARNSRNNVVKTIGQDAFTTNDADQDLIRFRVDAIRTGARCEARGYTAGPEKGQFIAVDITAATTSAFGANDDPNILTNGWSVVTADGRRHQVGSGPAYGCAPSRRDLENLGAGINVQGTILLDAPKDVVGGVVVLSPPSLSPGGWEWQIPA